jgi:23S rRNA (pseudouridine1915-N3)-methyltransferase
VLLRVIAIGKLKDARVAGLCDEYVVRSRPLVPIERVECKSQREQWQRALDGAAPVVLLDERGQQLDTIALARWIEAWQAEGRRRVDFLVGDADGYDEAARARADRVLALSRLTLPHRLAQLILCEQLYRVGTILAGHPYHHV